MRRFLFVFVVLTLCGGAAARADSTTSLPIAGLSSIVVDDAHQHVFLTGDATDSVVLVTDMTGQVVKTFSGEGGASGMVLSNGTLYVARCGTTSIDTFDAATLSKTGTINATVTIDAPCDLAKAGGRLWLTNGEHLVSVTLDAAHTVASFPDSPLGTFSTAPGAPGLLLVSYWDAGWLYDVSGQSPSTLSMYGTSNLNELNPDGGSVVSEYRGQDMLHEGPVPAFYPNTSQYDFEFATLPTVIAFTSDGAEFAASTVARPASTPSIRLFQHVAGYPQEPYAVLPEPAPVLGMAFAADGSKLFVVEHDSGGTTMRVLTSPLRPGAFISAGAPQPQVGDPLEYGGTLSFSDGASPLGKTVALTLIDPDGKQTSLGNATADAQGTFTKTLPDPFDREGHWFVRATYQGDATHQRTASSTLLVVSRRTTTLDLQTTPGALVAGTNVSIGGTLTLLGPAGVGGRHVAVYATPPGGSETLLAMATTDQSGAYSVGMLVDMGGDWRFRAAYAGDVTYAPATAGPIDVHADWQLTELSIASTRTLITYGGHITLTATLGPTHTNRAVKIVRIASDGSRSTVAQGQVDSDGHFSVTTKPGRTLRFEAQFAGDTWFAPTTSQTVKVRVRAKVTVTANNAYRSVGGVRLFHYAASCITTGRRCPEFTGRVQPNHHGRLIDFVLQHRTGSRWALVGSDRFRLDRRSRRAVIFHYVGTSVREGSWRVRVHFFADQDHLSADSKWLVFRVTA